MTPAPGRKSCVRVLGVDPELDRVAAERHVRLAEAERLAGRDPHLRRDHVDAGERLGHRVLDLDAAVDLDEVDAAVAVDQELERADVLVAGRGRRPDGPLGEVGPGALRRGRASAPPRGSSGGGAGRSSRARRGGRRGRSGRWRPGPRRGGSRRATSRGRASRRRSAAFASDRQTRSADSSSRGVRTMRMPLPPPPADGLMRTG